MSDNIQQYKYSEMANKVVRADRRMMDKGGFDDKSINTNPQSIVGKINVKDIGSSVQQDPKRSREDLDISNYIDENKKAKRRKKTTPRTAEQSLFDSNLESFNYTPTNDENNTVFEQILNWCNDILDSDMPNDVVRSTADITLEILKNDSFTDLVKKSKVEEAIGIRLSDDSFQTITTLSKDITDYEQQDFTGDESDDSAMGLAIDEEDEEEDEDESEDDIDEAPSDADLNEIQDVNDDDNIIQLANENNIQSSDSVKIKSIDQFWLTRQIASELPDLQEYEHSNLSSKINELFDQLHNDSNIRTFERELLSLFPEETNRLVQVILSNHNKIYYGRKLSLTKNAQDKKVILEEMKSNDLQTLVDEYQGKQTMQEPEVAAHSPQRKQANSRRTPKYVDLDNLIFEKGPRLMPATTFQLPQGSFKREEVSWKEIHIPPPKQPTEEERLIEISELPGWAQTVFPSTETKTLNRIQSRVYPIAFNDDSNILMCAPTGAGKTNVAMLTILRIIANHKRKNGNIDLNSFKIVYIAPLKALVQEQVREFERRLKQFNITVNELSGDSNLTKHQIASTQILVTTPEKWDVITRKGTDLSYVNLVRLIIIDEIHLLHDVRGPVIESIVARTLRNVEENNGDPVRLVGLSATLPNYKDVAKFLRVETDKGLFYFDSSYRPCPLAQQFIGITENKSLKKLQAMNEACYRKVKENIEGNHKVIIFVHSRKETEKTAKWIADKLIENNETFRLSEGVKRILKEESEKVKNDGLKNVLQMGFGIHHAGMNKSDRSTVEDLFAEGHLKVLVSTATLAWGVNLPAHTVIIKGTSIYSPEKGSWVELSPQDILQMLGRAGRPRYDTHGEGIIITAQEEVNYYLAILNQQLPIESQLYSRLADDINAEIVAGTIKNIEDCINWISYTYLFVRMIRARSLYHVGPEYDNDTDLGERRRDLSHSALMVLAKNGLVKYNFDSGIVLPTDLGKIASYYYISYRSMKNYDKQIKPYMSEVDLFRIFATSEEFKYIPVRLEEKVELAKLMEKAPIPINESSDDPLAKVNILLQAYISKLSLDGFALMSDMIYVVQSAGRLFRAMQELALRKGWPDLSKLLISLCKMVEKRLWLTNTPLRQFTGVPREVIQTAERSLIPWKHYLNLKDEYEVAQAFKAESSGRLVYNILQKFPKVSVEPSVLPITPSLLKIELEVTPNWKWDVDVHGFSESFTVLVEDCDSQKLLYVGSMIIKKQYIDKVHVVEFTVPMIDELQPNYFVSLVSDRWLHCGTRIPLMFTNLKVPAKFAAPTQLLDLQLIPTSELGFPEFTKLFKYNHFNKIQSQLFDAVYNDSSNVLCCTSKGNGKTDIGILALLNHWKNEKGRAVYLNPCQEEIDTLFKSWKKSFANIAGGKIINKLTGELTTDLKLLGSSHLILGTPEQFDLITRLWMKRANVRSIELIIADNIHSVGNGALGSVYEIVLSRMRFVAINLEKEIRIVGLSCSVACVKDLGDWIGASKRNIFNFDSKERVHPVSVKFTSFDVNHNPSLILAMIKPAYGIIQELDENKGEETAIVFVPTRKHCVDISVEFIKLLNRDETSWLKAEEDSLEPYLNKIVDPSLKACLSYGIGYFHKGMASSDKGMIEKLFAAGALTCLLATKDTSYFCPPSSSIIVLSTQEYEGKEHRYIDYTVNDLLEMVGLARIEECTAKCHILTNASKIAYYKKFLAESLPIESHLHYFLHDAFVSEIGANTVKNRQDCVDWLTYSYFYRRFQDNPSFYGVKNTSSIGYSEYLSELVETTLEDLVEGKMIELQIDDEMEHSQEEEDDDDKVEITGLNGCMIAAYYNVSFITMQTFAMSVTSKSRLKRFLEIVTSAYELESVPIRTHENEILSKIYNRLPIKSSSYPNYESPAFKSFILLQAHFSRLNLPPDLNKDLQYILSKVINLLYALIDIISSEGYLNAIDAMDLTQMVIQAMWSSESPLKQVPYFSDEILEKCESKKVQTVYDIMALTDENRNIILKGLSSKQVNKVAEFVNSYPNLELSYELDLKEPIFSNEEKELIINITRDEELEDPYIIATEYPFRKLENWWIVVGENSTKQLYGIKKLAITKESQQVKLKFTVPDAGTHDLTVWCVCDSYIDADKQIVIKDVQVKPE